VLEASDTTTPKLFKLTAAVTSIAVIIKAIKEVLARHPTKKAGVTLANTFPTLGFRNWSKRGKWDEAVVYGMSGGGVAPISYLTLGLGREPGRVRLRQRRRHGLQAGRRLPRPGLRQRADVTAPMKYGYGYVDDLTRACRT
jgi:hypothetical protein